MKHLLKSLLPLPLIVCSTLLNAQQTVFPGADETSPSRAQYFSWINNTNEGADEEHTRINLEFFGWLKKEYGMQLDIYGFDAGAIDGAKFYGSTSSDRFKKQFPNGFGPNYEQAKALGIRLGVWGGPDGFGDTPEEEKARIDQMVKLCKDYEFALFKFDAVCGVLRPEKEDAFIEMMTKARQHSPDLILLNHRLGLTKAKPHATTFLFGGAETYIDVHMTNRMTAPHHRAQALARGGVPDLQRLTEDHGVCISSCIDYWEDDLILQAFNRALILSPQIYGNPWLLNDHEFAKLARIFNLHKKYRDILIKGIELPESYGPNAVARGNKNTRFLTMRNLNWDSTSYKIKLDKEIGLESKGKITLVQLHPTEKVLGTFQSGEVVDVKVHPFRACMVMATTEIYSDPVVNGVDFEVIKDLPGKPVEINLLGMPGTTSHLTLLNTGDYKSATIDGKDASTLLKGQNISMTFDGALLKNKTHRKLAEFTEITIPKDANALYEATIFASDNNAMEVRSLQRSGKTNIPEVKAARDAFFKQKTFIERSVWDKNLFDGDLETRFFPSTKIKTNRPAFRIDLGKVQHVDEIIVTLPDVFSLSPMKEAEGNFVEISSDLKNWETITYLAGNKMNIPIGKSTRYLRFKTFARQISEIEAIADGKKLDRSNWKASNLFTHPSSKKALKAWSSKLTLDEVPANSYLCVAINGVHGQEGAYVSAKIDGKLVGAPDRAPSMLCNPWEYFASGPNKNYTYYIPMKEEYKGKNIELFVLGYDKANLDYKSEVWITAYPFPWERSKLVLERK